MTNDITGIDIRKALIASRGKSSPHENKIRETALDLELDPNDPDFPAMIDNIAKQFEMGRDPHL